VNRDGQGKPDQERRYTAVFERHQEIMERRKSDEASESGFTLIELLIVIVVLGILAAIVVFSLSGVTGESKQAACTTDAKSVEIAADAYQAAHNNSWPTTMQSLVTGNYLKSIPVSDNGYTISISPTVGNIQYTPTGGSATLFDDATGCQGIS
jgi:prepilin-type N-terminal cleavage/methylation domain-containing protein